MKTIWTVICVLALANALAVLGFLGWLLATDRLDGARLNQIRTMFATTVSQQQSDDAAKAAQSEQQQADAAESARTATPPATIEEQLAEASQTEEVERQRLLRLQREAQDLLNDLQKKTAAFERERAEFIAMKEAFEKTRAEIAAASGDEQFQKALKLYESVKPAESAQMLRVLLAEGNTDRVVSYLDAMAPRTASRIVSEILKGDPKLAADLLERLRARGIDAAPAAPVAAGPTAQDPSEG